jgi:hypothetical protein
MRTRVSKSKIETQGRGEQLENGERKVSMEGSESRSYTEAYQAILARELLINDLQEEHSKSF